MDTPQVRLKKTRDRSLRRRHPWLYSGAIDKVEGDPEMGGIVRVVDDRGAFLAWGYFNPLSKIQVRILDWQESSLIDEEWWRCRLRRSLDMRRKLPSLRSANACRLVYSEADGLPGLIVDKYLDYIVVQVLSAGVERVRALLFELLRELTSPEGIYERSDVEIRELEGLSPLSGPASGDVPPVVEIREGQNRFCVDIKKGHKTGFYLDQRANRDIVSEYAADREVLDLFSYTGAFAIAALRAGAKRVTLVESSSQALDVARQNFDINGIAPDRAEFINGNAFDVVREYRDSGRRFGMLICDPPKFAHSKVQLPKAERAYKDINLMAMKLLEPDGMLATFSCSGAMGIEEFSKIVAWASIDASREIQVLQRLSQAHDHPINPCFPESEYLKGLICRAP
ncbi:MAG: class I SAM-dependent rRNA methyltransferase [Candidatus Krumholzibacteria bacterium]|nr:class I SAM-dependent rRNA methyltransferase [Candidatus Krumholzibacteria bacterium]